MRLFARAREAARTSEDHFDAATVGEVCEQAVERYGEEFARVLRVSRIWVNGDEPGAGGATELAEGDEVAVLPPVSGGAGAAQVPGGAGPRTG